MIVLIAVNAFLFICLSLLHFYWAAGGHWAIRAAVPTLNGKPVLKISPLSCLVVGVGLLLFALITFGNTGFFDAYIDRSFTRTGTGIISAIFLLRAIGDFKYVGFFKSVKNTPFAINDYQLYSPMCLFLAIEGFAILFLNISSTSNA